jgi:hypothetical protein
MNSSRLFFTLRRINQVQTVFLAPSQIQRIVVEQSRIIVYTTQGHFLINESPTKKEKQFWSYCRLQKGVPIRWDMASPDVLAMDVLEEFKKTNPSEELK